MKCSSCRDEAAPGRRRCASCLKKAAKLTAAYRARNPERCRAAVKRWAEAHPDYLRITARERRRKDYRANPEKYRSQRREYRKRNRAAVIAQERARYRANPEKYRLYSRANRHGLTVDQLRALLARTNCEICERPFGSKETMQHVDHDHATGVVRGVLCHRCNTMLGKLEESLELIAKFAAYLVRHSRERAA